ncbi:MAG: hypothetical protein JWN04_5107 [Myxococcaceae bacterium]|nr:hypothetical protein [Myxococcaceae bacterium]
MKERLVRGTNVASVLRALRSQRRLRPLPELGDWEQDLLRRRVAPSTWYSLKVFDSLLQIVHRFVYDGSEAAAQTMGRTFALSSMADAPDLLVVSGDPLATLGRVPARWREQYNFGEMHVTPLPARDAEHGVRVRINAYPDMSACHGHAIMGFTVELAEQAGAQRPKLLLEERPWMHNSVLSYTMTWTQI